MNEKIDRLNCLLMKAKTIFTDSESADTDSTIVNQIPTMLIDSDLQYMNFSACACTCTCFPSKFTFLKVYNHNYNRIKE